MNTPTKGDIRPNSAQPSTRETLNCDIAIQFEQTHGVLECVLHNGEHGGDHFTVPHVCVIAAIGAVSCLLDAVANACDELWRLNLNEIAQEELHLEISIILSQCKGVLRLVLDDGEAGSRFTASHSSVITSLGAVSRLLDMAAQTHEKLWRLGGAEQTACASPAPAFDEVAL